MEQADTIIQIPHFYGSLKGMQDKFDKYARQDAFTGSTREEWEAWKETSRETLKDLLGWKYMETCDLDPRVEEVLELENGIRREKVIRRSRTKGSRNVFLPFRGIRVQANSAWQVVMIFPR